MIESLMIGAATGYVANKLNIKTEIILGVGLTIGAITGTLTLPVGLGLLGACVVTGLKELVSNTYNESEEYNNKATTELEDIETIFTNGVKNPAPYTGPVNNTETSIERVLVTPYNESTGEEEVEVNSNTATKKNSVKEAKGSFISHISTLIILAPAVAILATIPALSTFILPVSLIGLSIAGWLSLTKNTLGTSIKNLAGVGIVGSLALYTLLNVGSGGSFLYFLALISIPSLLIKDEVKEKVNESLFNLKNNFLYGNSGAQLPIIGGAVALLQTIVMGSGQDMLGTLINSDYSILLDPYRMTILCAVVGITAIFGATLLKNDEAFKKSIKDKDSKINKVLKVALTVTSIGIIATQFNPVVGAFAVCAGMTAKLLLKNNTNKIAIGALLIIGALTSV